MVCRVDGARFLCADSSPSDVGRRHEKGDEVLAESAGMNGARSFHAKGRAREPTPQKRKGVEAT